MGRYTADTVARIAAYTGEPDWMAERRHEALERFTALPWPDQSIEEWRHTDLRSLDIEAFDPFPEPLAAVDALEALPDAVRHVAIGDKGDRSALGVRVDNYLVHLRAAKSLADKGVILDQAHRVAAEHRDLVESYLGRAGYSDYEAKLVAMNGAFSTGRTFCYVPPGVEVALPLDVVRWIDRPGIAIFPHLVLVAGEGSSVTYVDHFAGAELPGPSFVAPVVEIYAEQAATVNYLGIQDWPAQVTHLGSLRAVVERDATVRTLAATFGGGLSRSVAQAVLEGRGAHAELLGIYFGDGDQHIDNRTLQLHRGPDTSSEVYYKGALKDHSRAVYSGLVDLEKEGVGADARQLNRNILLSEGASADANPFLEIKTSEVVRATHGVSVGRPNAETLFYLASRGLDPAEAERVFVTGFFQELIDRVHVPEIRERLEAAVVEELEARDGA
ncbi:MAG TPA: Fe-S cluster assembly protein SufD [Actinomycetota bacterium]